MFAHIRLHLPLAMLFTCCAALGCGEQMVPQRIDMLLEKMHAVDYRKDDTAKMRAIKDAALEPSQEVLDELMQRVGAGRDNGRYLRNICISLGSQAEGRLSEALRTENDPEVKGRLIWALVFFRTIPSLKAAIACFDDKRYAEQRSPLTEGWPDRVCDLAYRDVTLIVSMVTNNEFESMKSGLQMEERDALILAFAAYWKKEEAGIAEKLKAMAGEEVEWR